MKITDKRWECQEAGWYIHPIYGGVCKESAETAENQGGPHKAGWYFYPRNANRCIGPYPNMTEAMAAAKKKGSKGRG
jgi:hypothetical protein